MIAELISDYGDVGALTILVGLMVWYLKYQTKRQAKREDKQDEERTKREEKRDKEQKEERDYYRNLLTNDMEKLHQFSVKNADLNNKSVALLKDVSKNQKEIGENQNKLCKLIESVDRKINSKLKND